MRERIGAPYIVVVRLDSSWIPPQLDRFLLRAALAGLLVVIAITAVITAILGSTVLAPILELRHRLRAASSDLEHADRHSIPVKRRDELGSALADFDRLAGNIARTIAELQQSLAEARANEERWRRVFDGSTDAILIVNPQTGLIIDANATAVRLFEYRWTELIGLKVEALDGRRSSLARLVETASRVGRADAEAVSCTSCNGRQILAEAQLATLPIGSSRHILLMIRDMTERSMAEEPLRL
jgi:PAS domain S-box-containing protein